MLKVSIFSFHAGCYNYVWTVTAWIAGKLQVSYESPQIHSLFVVTSLWRSLTSVTQTVDFRCFHAWKSKGFNSGERIGHAVGPTLPIHCSGNTLVNNFRTARRKCDGTPILSESQSADPHLARAVQGCYVGLLVKSFSQKWGSKQGPISLSPAVLAWKLQSKTLNIFFNLHEAENLSHPSRRPVFK
jgi:hypothetical protein